MNRFWSLLFPQRCPVCDRLLETSDIREGRLIHDGCRARLYPVKQPQCFHCGRPLEDEEKEYCFDCAKGIAGMKSPAWKGKPFSYFQQGKAVFLYQGDIKKTMYRFKYSNRREYASFLAEEAYREYGEWIVRCGVEAVIPVPMYRKKERRRGYNQAKLLAREIARRTGLAYEPEALRRVRDTRPQKELNDRERENNVKNAFQVSDFVVKYNCILLVDDIYTTGCTAETISKELRQAGVQRIYFLASCIGRGL